MENATECRCEGLGLVREMILLYTDIAKGGVSARATPEQKKEANALADRIRPRISEKDIFQEGHSPEFWKHALEKAEESSQKCKEENDFECLMSLEWIRTIIHGDWGVRAALICDPKFDPGNASKDNKAIWWSQYQMRGNYQYL